MTRPWARANVRAPLMRNHHLLACLILSGFCGLSYELLWVRLLALGFGSTTLSFSTVLAVFFGGLALGAWLAGRRAGRLQRPVRAYALVEVGTGVLALLLYPLLAHVGTLFALLDPGPGLAGVALRALFAAPLLLGPTLLMGASLPIVVKAMIREDAEVGTGTALIYGFNTLGAFAGTYLITYFVLPELGVFKSTLITAGINFAAAGLAVVREERDEAAQPLSSQPSETEDVPEKVRWVATVLAFTAGFSAICFQVVWVRLFSIFLSGTVYGVGSVLISVLAGIGLGSLFIAPQLRRSRVLGLWFAALQLVTLLSVVFITANFSAIAYVLHSLTETGQGLSILNLQLLVVLAVLLLPSSSSGASFPVLLALVERKAEGASQSLGGLYSANTVGSIVGSVLTGFVLLPLAGTVATTFIGLIAVALVGALAAALLSENASTSARGLFALAPLLIVSMWTGFDAQAISQANASAARRVSYAGFKQKVDARKEKVVFFSEGQVATVVVNESGSGARGLTLSGLGQGSRLSIPPHYNYESLMVALVPMSHAKPSPKALVVGLGAGATIKVLLDLGAEHVDVVELEPDVVEALEHIYPTELNPLRDKRVTLRQGDARHALLVDSHRGGGSFDLITSMPAHPWVASSIFTREFFELARANLSEEGVFSTWFGLGRMDEVAVEGLLRAFALTFENYAVYHLEAAGALYVVGSKKPLEVDVDRFEQLMAAESVAAMGAIDSKLHLAARVVASGRAGDPPPTPGPVNDDDTALVEMRAPRTATVAKRFGTSLPRRALAPEMLRSKADKSATALALFEEALSSEGGRPDLGRSVPAARLRAQLEAWKAVLPPETFAYLEGRILLIERKHEAAQERLREVTGPLAERAARFLPYTYLDEKDREAALRTAPLSGLSWLSRSRLDPEGVKERLSIAPPTREADRWAWLAWHALTETSTTPELRFGLAEVGRRLAAARHLEGLELAEAWARRARWAPERAALAAALVGAKQRRALGALRAGKAAGEKGDFETARTKLEEAMALAPSRAAAELLVVALVEVGATDERLEAWKAQALLVGFSAQGADYTLEQARKGRRAP